MRANVMYARFGGRVHYCWRPDRERKSRGHGGLSVYYGRNLDREIGGKVSIEYHVGRPVYALGGHIEFDQGADEPVSLGASLWPFSVYASIDTPVARRVTRKLTKPTWDGEREIAVHLSSRDERTTVRWSLWHPSMSWSSGTPRWRNGSWDLTDALLGRREMRWEPDEPRQVTIPMPEGSYDATVTMRDHVSWRKRLPFWTRRLRCADVDIPGGIGHPGKGENAWDCGDDATFAMSCSARTVEDAIGKVVASVLRDRKRYGGSYTFTPMEKSA